MRKIDRMSELPEVTRYTKYYEHDGMLRAYANRAMLLAMIFGVLANGKVNSLVDIKAREGLVLALAAIAVLGMGLYPQAFAGVLHNSVNDLLAMAIKSKI